MDIEKLEKFARAASEGKWTTFIKERTIAILTNNDNYDPIIQWNGFDSSNKTLKEQKANARFIVAAQPSVVLELVDRIRQLEHYKEHRSCSGCWGDKRLCDCKTIEINGGINGKTP